MERKKERKKMGQTKKPLFFGEKAGRTESMPRTQDGTPEPVWMSRTHTVPSTPPPPTHPTTPPPPFQPQTPTARISVVRMPDHGARNKAQPSPTARRLIANFLPHFQHGAARRLPSQLSAPCLSRLSPLDRKRMARDPCRACCLIWIRFWWIVYRV